MERLMRAKEILTAQYGIQFGIPLLPPQERAKYRNDPFESINVPWQPHVFFVKHVDLREHEEQKAELRDVLVMMAHGDSFTGRDGQEVYRFFGTGKTVYDTVDAYQNFAEQGIVPNLDVVIACRGSARAELRDGGSLVIHPRKPLLITPGHKFPQIYPGSLVNIGSSWRRGQDGVDNLTANATEWQGLHHWQQRRQEEYVSGATIIYPGWTKTPRPPLR